MNTSTRILEYNDLNQITKLIHKHKFRLENENGIQINKAYINYLENYLSNDEKGPFLIGNFVAENLSTMIGFSPWKALPYSTILFLFSFSNFNLFNPTFNGLINCLDYGIHLSEQNGIFNFYYFKKTNQKISNNNSWLNLWEKHKLNSNFLKYYTSKQIAIISPGSKPPYSIYWEVIDKKVWPFEIEIRELSLMNNHKHRFKVGFY